MVAGLNVGMSAACANSIVEIRQNGGSWIEWPFGKSIPSHRMRNLSGNAYISLSDPLVPVHQPALLLQLALERGVRGGDLLAATGLRVDHFSHPETRLSYAQIAVLVERAMALTGDPGLGLAFGRRIRLGHLAELGAALACAPTMNEALHTMIRFQKLLGSAFDMRIADRGDHVALVASKSIPLGANYRFNQETWLSTAVSLSRQLLEREVPELVADFDYPAPGHAARYVEVFGGNLRFDQASCQIHYPKTLLRVPLPGASPTAYQVALLRCESVWAKYHQPQSLQAQLRKLLHSRLENPPQADEVARTLKLSLRTLHRRLRELDTSYRQMLNEEKSAAAMALLRDSNLSIGSIAARLGFGDPSNFIKAFRAWNGKTPQQFRSDDRR